MSERVISIGQALEYGHPNDPPSTFEERVFARMLRREKIREGKSLAQIDAACATALTQDEIDNARAIIKKSGLSPGALINPRTLNEEPTVLKGDGGNKPSLLICLMIGLVVIMATAIAMAVVNFRS